MDKKRIHFMMNRFWISTNREEQMKSLIKSSLPVFSLLLLCSCVDSGKSAGTSSSGSGSGISQNEEIMPDGSNVQGDYAADIWPVNYNLHFKTIGMVGVKRDGDSFSATVNMKYGPKGARVKQAIYTARRCPNLKDDLNKDAYIDILEARAAIGKITIPFDSDLDSQISGSGDYPVVDINGKMFYSQSASFSRMFEDLKGIDENTDDQIIKLKEDEGITFPGRIVLFQGVPEKVALPESVATTDGESRHESLPVGCAVLWKVKKTPAELMPDTQPTM